MLSSTPKNGKKPLLKHNYETGVLSSIFNIHKIQIKTKIKNLDNAK